MTEEKSSRPEDAELAQALYLALQGIIACPTRECKCCGKHDSQALLALSDFLNRWRGS